MEESYEELIKIEDIESSSKKRKLEEDSKININDINAEWVQELVMNKTESGGFVSLNYIATYMTFEICYRILECIGALKFNYYVQSLAKTGEINIVIPIEGKKKSGSTFPWMPIDSNNQKESDMDLTKYNHPIKQAPAFCFHSGKFEACCGLKQHTSCLTVNSKLLNFNLMHVLMQGVFAKMYKEMTKQPRSQTQTLIHDIHLAPSCMQFSRWSLYHDANNHTIMAHDNVRTKINNDHFNLSFCFTDVVIRGANMMGIKGTPQNITPLGLNMAHFDATDYTNDLNIVGIGINSDSAKERPNLIFRRFPFDFTNSVAKLEHLQGLFQLLNIGYNSSNMTELIISCTEAKFNMLMNIINSYVNNGINNVYEFDVNQHRDPWRLNIDKDQIISGFFNRLPWYEDAVNTLKLEYAFQGKITSTANVITFLTCVLNELKQLAICLDFSIDLHKMKCDFEFVLLTQDPEKIEETTQFRTAINAVFLKYERCLYA